MSDTIDLNISVSHMWLKSKALGRGVISLPCLQAYSVFMNLKLGQGHQILNLKISLVHMWLKNEGTKSRLYKVITFTRTCIGRPATC